MILRVMTEPGSLGRFELGRVHFSDKVVAFDARNDADLKTKLLQNIISKKEEYMSAEEEKRKTKE